MFSNIFKRKSRTIQKPNFPLCITKSFISVTVVTLIAALFAIPGIDEFINSSEVISMTDYSEDIISAALDFPRTEQVDKRIDRSARNFVNIGLGAKLEVDGEEVANTTNHYSFYDTSKTDDGYIFGGYYEWDESLHDEFSELYSYSVKDTIYTTIFYIVRDYYYDEASGYVYPGVVDVYKIPVAKQIIIPDFVITEGKLIATVDVTPNASAIDSYNHVISEGMDTYIMVGIPADYVSKYGTENTWYSDTVEGTYTDESGTHSYRLYANYDLLKRTTENNTRVLLTAVIVAVIIITLILATIRYFKEKSTYEIFEYRRKTTEAMAHDLKTPLAVIFLSASNLKELIKSNPEKCIKHADEIEESISYTNELIENILEFSKSESSAHNLKIAPLNIRANVENHISEITATLEANNMKAEITGEGTIKTDADLWNQAVSNLIDNAVKHGKSNGTISIDIKSNGLTIANPTDEEITNPEKLLEPFVKGNSSRGENSGSGLGLAIADNNLRTLGYKLLVEYKKGKFVATIRK